VAGVLGQLSFLGNDWKEHVRRPLRIAIDLVNYRLARPITASATPRRPRGFKQVPDPVFGFVDPVLKKASARHVAMLFT
jgi:hypothetical protein